MEVHNVTATVIAARPLALVGIRGGPQEPHLFRVMRLASGGYRLRTREVVVESAHYRVGDEVIPRYFRFHREYSDGWMRGHGCVRWHETFGILLLERGGMDISGGRDVVPVPSLYS
jgi:hypothetical protein